MGWRSVPGLGGYPVKPAARIQDTPRCGIGPCPSLRRCKAWRPVKQRSIWKTLPSNIQLTVQNTYVFDTHRPLCLIHWPSEFLTLVRCPVPAYIWRKLGLIHLHLLVKSIFENQRMCDGDPVRLHRMLLPIVEAAHLQDQKQECFVLRRAHIWVEEVGHPWPRMAGCHFLALKRKLKEPCNLWHNSRSLMYILSLKGGFNFAYMMYTLCLFCVANNLDWFFLLRCRVQTGQTIDNSGLACCIDPLLYQPGVRCHYNLIILNT